MTPDIEEIYTCYEAHVNPVYPSFLRRLGIPYPAASAEGAVIRDVHGKEYIDCTSGYGLLNLGHNHPSLIEVAIDQLRSRQPLTRPMITGIQARLAQRLAAATPGDLECVFLCNSGSEGIDSAIKLARLTTGRPKILSALGSFHGYTYGALSASGIPKLQKAFGPLVPGIDHVPYGETPAVQAALGPDVAAVLLEPVQHEAGVRLPPDGYLRAVRDLCDAGGVLLILDEVKTGFGRTGPLFACDSLGIVPDILVLGKSLGGGLVPAGAVVARKSLWRRFGLSFGMSASSYAGNALACRVALRVLELIREGPILEEGSRMGGLLQEGLGEAVHRYPSVLEKVRSVGLLASLRAANPALANAISSSLCRRGVLAMTAFGDGAELMFEPPLIITERQVAEVAAALEDSCREVLKDLK